MLYSTSRYARGIKTACICPRCDGLVCGYDGIFPKVDGECDVASGPAQVTRFARASTGASGGILKVFDRLSETEAVVAAECCEFLIVLCAVVEASLDIRGSGRNRSRDLLRNRWDTLSIAKR